MADVTVDVLGLYTTVEKALGATTYQSVCR